MSQTLAHGALALHALMSARGGSPRMLLLSAAGGKPSPVATLIFPLPGVQGTGAGVPDPPAAPVPGLSGSVDTILGWMKWGSLIAGVAGLTLCAVKMMIGHRNRSTVAADGASGIPWVLAGLSLAAFGASIVGVFL